MDTAQSTAVTIPQRAAVALKADQRRADFMELVKASAEITAITNPAGYQECHAARMRLKNARVEITKKGKEVRDDAVKFQKGVIALEQELVAIIEPEEKRLQGIQDEHDTRIERERQAKIEAETRRVELIQSRIQQDIRAAGHAFTPMSGSVVISTVLGDIKAIVIDEWFAEFKNEAEAAKVATVVRLTQLREDALKYEAEQRQIRADREELDRRRAEEDERIRKQAEVDAAAARKRAEEDAARQAEFDRVAREARLKIEADERAAAERIAEQERVARLAREAEERKSREQQERNQMAMSEIQGIQQQVIIAQIGRAGVRVGGTIECIEETLAETEAWPIDAERFGILAGSAQAAKTAALRDIRALLAKAKADAAESARLADLRKREDVERAEAERKAREDQAVRDADAHEVQRKADELLGARDMLVTFRNRYADLAEFAKVHKAIDAYMTDYNKERKAA